MNKAELISEFNRIGIREGDTIFIRISYKSLGNVKGGPETVIRALRETVGESGNIVASAMTRGYSVSPFLLKRIFSKKVVFKPSTEKISTGILPKLLSKEPDAIWSTHPIFTCVVVGPNAQQIAEEHTPKSKPYDILVNIANNYKGKTLRIGGELLTGIGHISIEEAFKKNNQFQLSLSRRRYYYNNQNKGKLYKDEGVIMFDHLSYAKAISVSSTTKSFLYNDKFFDTEASLINMKEQLKLEINLFAKIPQILLCSDPLCTYCAYTFSFSKNQSNFLRIQSKRIFTKEWKSAVSGIKNYWQLKFFGHKIPF